MIGKDDQIHRLGNSTVHQAALGMVGEALRLPWKRHGSLVPCNLEPLTEAI